MEETATSVELSKQLLAAAGIMVATTTTHALGLTCISRCLHLRSERLDEMSFDLRAVAVMSGMALLLLALHTVEIGVFAVFYLWIGALQNFEEALYYSASAYATLGRTADYFPEDWRLLGAIEALVGFLMIGWSTAFIVSKANRLMPD